MMIDMYNTLLMATFPAGNVFITPWVRDQSLILIDGCGEVIDCFLYLSGHEHNLILYNESFDYNNLSSFDEIQYLMENILCKIKLAMNEPKLHVD